MRVNLLVEKSQEYLNIGGRNKLFLKTCSANWETL